MRERVVSVARKRDHALLGALISDGHIEDSDGVLDGAVQFCGHEDSRYVVSMGSLRKGLSSCLHQIDTAVACLGQQPLMRNEMTFTYASTSPKLYTSPEFVQQVAALGHACAHG